MFKKNLGFHIWFVLNDLVPNISAVKIRSTQDVWLKQEEDLKGTKL